jgi:hypothetical protein
MSFYILSYVLGALFPPEESEKMKRRGEKG